MNIVKKSFEITGDVAQTIDDLVHKNPGLSFTFIINKALEGWLASPNHEVGFRAPSSKGIKTVKKSANIKAANAKKMEQLAKQFPGLNSTLILNMALQNWLKRPFFDVPAKYSEKDVDQFLDENAKLMDELAK